METARGVRIPGRQATSSNNLKGMITVTPFSLLLHKKNERPGNINGHLDGSIGQTDTWFILQV